MKYEITFAEKPSREDLKVLDDGLMQHANAIFGNHGFTSVAFFLRDETGAIVGGAAGNYGSFGWLYVDSLWVGDSLRGQGYGSQLMDRIESEAIKHGCTKAFLSTMSYQAPGFYKKRGYTVFGELDDFPKGYSRIFLRKNLV
jgi:N-acetylglutamate synthase-like GNAT family acetyltransferase